MADLNNVRSIRKLQHTDSGCDVQDAQNGEGIGAIRRCPHGFIQWIRSSYHNGFYWSDLEFYVYPWLWTRAWWVLSFEKTSA
jgi:hypothetical protein